VELTPAVKKRGVVYIIATAFAVRSRVKRALLTGLSNSIDERILFASRPTGLRIFLPDRGCLRRLQLIEILPVIHSTAIIDPTAEIAEDVSIGAYAVVGPQVEIGSGSSIADHATLYGPTRIGRNNRILQHTTLGGAPQDLHYEGEPTRLVIGDRNTIREYASISRGSVGGGGVTTIGDDNFIMAYAHIGHDCQVGDQNVITNSVALAGHVHVGDKCNLGGFSLVHQFVHIGSFAFTSMGSAINRDVPPFVTVSGNYARSYGINKIGLRRNGLSAETINAIYKAYKLLVRRRGGREEALQELEPLVQKHGEVKLFVDFVLGSTRGIVK
jgi:UDP-N-acetylglucosamine acyltransferase